MADSMFDAAIFDADIFDASVPFGYTLEAESAPGTWMDITGSVLTAVPLKYGRGIFQRGPTGSIARPGFISFGLDNSALRGAEGRWTPGHANAPAWWQLETRVRLTLTFNAAIKRYRVRLDQITPDAGVNGPRRVLCSGLDWLSEFATQDAADLALLENVRVDEALQAVVDLLPDPPAAVSFDVGTDEFPFVFDDLGGRFPKALAVTQDLVQSDGGLLVLRGDDDEGETLRFFNRLAPMYEEVQIELTGAHLIADPSNPRVTWTRSDIVNYMEVQTVERRADDDATALLIALDNPLTVASGQTETFNFDYKDPNSEADHVGGVDMQPLSSASDWSANSKRDGTGRDLTANFDVVASYSGSRATISVTNNSGSDGFVRGFSTADGLQARGRGLYRYAPSSVPATNAPSVAKYKQRPLTSPFSMPYQTSPTIGQAVAALKVHLWGGMLTQPQRVRIRTEMDDALLEQGIARDVGDKISVMEEMTAVDGIKVIVAAVEGEIVEGHLRVWWTLLPTVQDGGFILDDPVRGILDENVLAFG